MNVKTTTKDNNGNKIMATKCELVIELTLK